MSDVADSSEGNVIEKLASPAGTALVPAEDDEFELRFNYLGLPLIAKLVPHPSGTLHMQLMGKVGRIPFSAEGRERRIGAMLLLRSTAKRRPTRFALTRQGDIALAGDVEVVAPVTPTSLITAVTTLLASIKPYLDIFPFFIETDRRPN